MFSWLARLALVAIALHLCSACQVYDPDLTSTGPAASGSDAMVMTLPDGGSTKTDAHTCKPGGTEVCNGADDDCDGVIDEMVATQLDCESRVVHAQTVCQSGYCLRIACLTGYYNCDGRPENGCEANCMCGMSCTDGGEDAGSDDAGR
jgi:Putative metal-binding motif